MSEAQDLRLRWMQILYYERRVSCRNQVKRRTESRCRRGASIDTPQLCSRRAIQIFLGDAMETEMKAHKTTVHLSCTETLVFGPDASQLDALYPHTTTISIIA